MSQNAAKGRLFDNCLILAPDGVALSRCELKKAQWYLDRNIAEVVESDPLTIKLLFEPAGRTGIEDPFTVAIKRNECVVCGATDSLNRHHVIPSCFLRHMPDFVKHFNSHDVMATCLSCHEKYESKSESKRQYYADKYQLPLHGFGQQESIEFHKIRNIARTLVRHRDKIPVERQQVLLSRLTTALGHVPDEDEIINLEKSYFDLKFKTMGQCVAEQITDYDAFGREWRQHFLDVMSPKFLPEHWRVDRIFFKDELFKENE